MAYSSSIIRAQTVKLCELCQEDNIKWRCVDCEMCLCEKCKTFHLRVPVTAKHQIVSIETPIQHVRKKIITDDIPCKDHVENMTCMFCKTCDRLVCPECVSTSHTKHRFIPIEKALNEKIKFLRETQTNVNDQLKVCDSKTKEIHTMMPQYNSICDDSVTKIKRREQELHDAINEHSKALQDMVETERSMAKTIASNVEQQADEAKKKLEDLKEKLEAALTFSQGQVIFDISVIEPGLDFNSLPDKMNIFIPGTEATTQIQELFGSLQDMIIPKVNMAFNIPLDSPEITIPTVNPELGFELLRTISTDLPYISKVTTLDEASAWISCGSSIKPATRKITNEGNNIVTSNEISLGSYDMALTSNNDILVAELNCSDVKLITTSMEIKSYLTVAPLRPRGIHVTNDNQVIIGVAESAAKFKPTGRSTRAVILFAQDGKQKSMYQFDGNRKRLFNIPGRITTNNNQDIVIIDWISNSTGRVVTLDREGNLKCVYDGHPKINDTKQFDPRGIATTAAGYIIVSDFSSNALHVLSDSGNILTYKGMDDMGVMFPWTLNIDKSDNLWVGCGTGGEPTGAQIHIIKMLA